MSATYPVGIRIYNGEDGPITGEPIECRSRYKYFESQFAAGGVMTIQGSSGHGDWHTLKTWSSFPGTYTNDDPWPYIRVNLDATMTGGTCYMAMGDGETYPVGIVVYEDEAGVVDPGVTTQCRGRHKTWNFIEGETATFEVQASFGYDDWRTLTTTSESGFYTNVVPWPYVRVNITASGGAQNVVMVMSR